MFSGLEPGAYTVQLIGADPGIVLDLRKTVRSTPTARTARSRSKLRIELARCGQLEVNVLDAVAREVTVAPAEATVVTWATDGSE